MAHACFEHDVEECLRRERERKDDDSSAVGRISSLCWCLRRAREGDVESR